MASPRPLWGQGLEYFEEGSLAWPLEYSYAVEPDIDFLGTVHQDEGNLQAANATFEDPSSPSAVARQYESSPGSDVYRNSGSSSQSSSDRGYSLPARPSDYDRQFVSLPEIEHRQPLPLAPPDLYSSAMIQTGTMELQVPPLDSTADDLFFFAGDPEFWYPDSGTSNSGDTELAFDFGLEVTTTPPMSDISESSPNQHMCNHCGKSFDKRWRLNNHDKSHSKGFKCPVCRRGFRYRKDRDRHKKSVHRFGRPLHCPVDGCQFTTARQDNLKRHATLKHRARPSTGILQDAMAELRLH